MEELLMPVYNKLVRDRIPEIIQKSGKVAITRKLSQEEYKVELQKKFEEELREYFDAKTDAEALEELADIYEILESLAQVHGATIAEVETIRYKKAEERGRFEDRIFLVEVKDE